jgi:hypothetical protein
MYGEDFGARIGRVSAQGMHGVVSCDPAVATVSQQDLPDFTGIRPGLVTPVWYARVASSLTELRDVAVARDAAPDRPRTWFRG